MNYTGRSYTTIIVDDNEIDQLHTLMYAKKYAFLDVVARFTTAEEAVKFLQLNNVEVLLLDIDMPGMSGLDLRKQLGQTHTCIFITAYPDYALESFELAALDFLVKPLKADRFDMAMQRLLDYLTLVQKAALYDYSLGPETVFIKDGHDQVKVPLHDIVYLEALKDYTRIVTPQKKYCVLSMLGNLLEEAAFKTFIRIHRSYAVQKNFINKVSSQQVFLDSITLPVGRTYKDALTRLITES